MTPGRFLSLIVAIKGQRLGATYGGLQLIGVAHLTASALEGFQNAIEHTFYHNLGQGRPVSK